MKSKVIFWIGMAMMLNASLGILIINITEVSVILWDRSLAHFVFTYIRTIVIGSFDVFIICGIILFFNCFFWLVRTRTKRHALWNCVYLLILLAGSFVVAYPFYSLIQKTAKNYEK